MVNTPQDLQIVRSLHGDSPPQVGKDLPPELVEEQEPIRMMGSTMFSAQLLQDVVSGATYTNMVTCCMSLVGLGVMSMVVECFMPTLLGEGDMDSN